MKTLTSRGLREILDDESMNLPKEAVDEMLDYEVWAERVNLTPLPGSGLKQRLLASAKRIVYGIRRAFIDAQYRGKSLRFSTHEEYEDWTRKIAHR